MLQIRGPGGSGTGGVIFDDRAFGFQGRRDKSEGQFSLVFVLVSRFGAHIDVGG